MKYVTELINIEFKSRKTQYSIMKQLNVKIGVCSLNNDPLDFNANLQRILRSVKKCKEMGCVLRVGAEMQIPGYGCSDHFMEYDTTTHSWDMIREIIVSKVTDDIVCEFGCPVLHQAALYNARVIIFRSKVVGIRVKMVLADGGNYFETRYFTGWKYPRGVADFTLPQCVQEVTGQRLVPIGVFILQFKDTSLAYEICEQSWISNNPMIDAALDGAEIFVNPSASEVERGKLKRKMQMIEEFTERHGGAYAYVNVLGVAGDRSYYDGCCLFSENGRIKELSQPFILDDMNVTPFVINLTAIRTFRISNKAFQKQSHGVQQLPRVHVDFAVATYNQEYTYDSHDHLVKLSSKRALYEVPHATFQPSAFLWDVLRKSHARGFFLPLSGGVDSASVAIIVYNLAHLLCEQCKLYPFVLQQLRRVLRDQEYIPTTATELCSHLLFTCYMGNENSSQSTRQKAKVLADSIGCTHREINFQAIYQGYKAFAERELGLTPKFYKEGGSWRTDLALQNVQARTRMVLSYFLSSLEMEGKKKEGFLLVLASANLDEALRGYYTKYDCSSADYNPIGSFSKQRIKQLLRWAQSFHNLPIVEAILNAKPSAQLRPLKEGETAQTDEQDMQLTYEELGIFGRLRKIERLGPVSMFDRIYSTRNYPDVLELGSKIKKFFTFYAINRHKCTTLTPAMHYNPESCDDNRIDMRPVFYATNWEYQFAVIDQRIRTICQRKSAKEII